MEIPIIKIGNSKGLRLPKAIIERYNLMDRVKVVLENDYIILIPTTPSRQGWEEAFQQMHQNGDDKLLIDDIFHDETL